MKVLLFIFILLNAVFSCKAQNKIDNSLAENCSVLKFILKDQNVKKYLYEKEYKKDKIDFNIIDTTYSLMSCIIPNIDVRRVIVSHKNVDSIKRKAQFFYIDVSKRNDTIVVNIAYPKYNEYGKLYIKKVKNKLTVIKYALLVY
jgi:hypothetical protein